MRCDGFAALFDDDGIGPELFFLRSGDIFFDIKHNFPLLQMDFPFSIGEMTNFVKLNLKITKAERKCRTGFQRRQLFIHSLRLWIKCGLCREFIHIIHKLCTFCALYAQQNVDKQGINRKLIHKEC